MHTKWKDFLSIFFLHWLDKKHTGIQIITLGFYCLNTHGDEMVLTQSRTQYEQLFPEKKFWMLIEIDQYSSEMRLKTTHPQYNNHFV